MKRTILLEIIVICGFFLISPSFLYAAKCTFNSEDPCWTYCHQTTRTYCNCPEGKLYTCCTSTARVGCMRCDDGTVVPTGGTSYIYYPEVCYPNGASCSCCTSSCNGSCDVPACPAGTQDTPSGCGVTSVESCSYNNSCNTGSCDGGSRTCYKSETNPTRFIQKDGSQDGPSSISIKIDGITYSLSTNPSNPTVIQLPCTTNVTISVPTYTAPTKSGGARYYFQADNYGLSPQTPNWLGGTTCIGHVGEDFCTSVSTNNTQSFAPTLGVNLVLKEGYKGKITGFYANKDVCSDTYRYSPPIEGYYRVETNTPVAAPTSITMSVDGDSHTLSTNPASPTIIQLPCTTNVTLTTPTFNKPNYSASQGYAFTADNYGLAPQAPNWLGGTACQGVAGEDFCIENTSNVQAFQPYSKTIPIVLNEGYKGKILASYYTTNRCGANKQYSGTATGYYEVETSPTVSAPTSGNMKIDNVTYALSSTSTIVKVPSSNTAGTVTLNEPTFNLPSGGVSKTKGYTFSADNYGLSPQAPNWLGGTACQGVAGEDFCTSIPNTNNTQNFLPYSKTITEVLKDGYKGKINYMYYTTNRCGDNPKKSAAYIGNYEVDTEPVPTPTPTPTPADIFPELNTDRTTKQCTSTTYTGKDIHNPLHIRVGLTDANNVNEIEGLVVWFSKDTTTPTLVTIDGTTPTMDVINDMGIFIRKNGDNWTTAPLMYGYDSTSQKWEKTTDGNIRNSSTPSQVVLRIGNVNVTTNSTVVTIDFQIEFFNVTITPSGMYNFYLEGVDTYMINSEILDQSRMTRYFNWGFDFVDPAVDDITQQLYDAINTRITWGVEDSISGIQKTVINAYRYGAIETDIAKLYLPTAYTVNKGNVVLNAAPQDSEIGMFNDANTWAFGAGQLGETDQLNIGINEGGEINLYVTTYDLACNTNGTNEEINLNAWFATRGASVYSNGNILTDVRDVSGLPALDGVFNTRTQMTPSKIDLGTELLSTRNTAISNLIHSSQGAAKATNLEDSNNTKAYWFNKLAEKFGRYKTELTAFVIGGTDQRVSTRCNADKCYMYSTENITIPANYVCDKKTLFVSEKDIHLNPNITSDLNSLSGCIFLAKNNIYVDAGTFKSTGTKVLYDYIEGYLIADNQIVFPVTDEASTYRDGVEIFGGIVAFGTNPEAGTSAISIKRNLRLYSQINPTVVLTYDNKYSSISTSFFGTEYQLYKQEVGFKTF